MLGAMTEPKNKKPQSLQSDTERAEQRAHKLKSEAKQAQLSEALRANLKRRKEQVRARKKANIT